MNPVAIVDLQNAIVVFPDHTELDDTLRDGHHLQCGLVLGVLLEERAVLETARKLFTSS